MREDCVKSMVSRCAYCQKNRLCMLHDLEPIVRNLKVLNLKKRIGVHNLSVTPVDKNGNGHIFVVFNHFSKHV